MTAAHIALQQLAIHLTIQNQETTKILKRVLEMDISKKFRKKIEKHLEKIK